MHAYQVIQHLEATAGRIDKEQILIDAFMSGQREFFVGARLACDVLITFGVQKVPAIAVDDLNPEDPGSFEFSAFLDLAERLRRRRLTGNAAADTIRAAAAICHGPTWNDFYRRVLQKDLRCGATTKTINKILKKLASAHPEAGALMIPVFECQLAHDGEDDAHVKKIKGNKLLDLKMDGVRLLTVLDKESGEVTQFTRNGLVNENFPAIREGLGKVLDEMPFSVVLDGEVIARSFQDLMTQVNRDKNVDTSGAKLALFDMVPLADFRNGICKVPQSTRHDMLSALEVTGLLRNATGGSVYVIPKIAVDLDTEEGQARFGEFNREALDAGYEGIMIKDPHAPYECKRSVAWLKKKPVSTFDLSVVDLVEGEPESKYAGMLGAMICEGTRDSHRIRVNVGSGFTDIQRRELWDQPDKLIGQIVEVEADCITKSTDNEAFSLRFPRFVRFRSIDGVPGVKD